MTRLTILIPAVILLAAPGLALQSKQGSDGSFEILLTAKQVDDAAVGIAGSRSEQYAAFAALWNEGDAARKSIDRLLDDGTMAGKIYGLLLLQHLDQKAAVRAAEKLKASTDDVDVLQGCLMMKYAVADLAERIVTGGHVIVTPAFAGGQVH